MSLAERFGTYVGYGLVLIVPGSVVAIAVRAAFRSIRSRPVFALVVAGASGSLLFEAVALTLRVRGLFLLLGGMLGAVLMLGAYVRWSRH